ncbi:MAG: hypothetical protein EXR81_01475 [Gammaproteobacteria bacterium]|nr:hypothetical protein [Gammaproteobacteria bacterium]
MELHWNNVGQWPSRAKIIVFTLWSLFLIILCYLIFLRTALLTQQRMQHTVQTLQLQITQQQHTLTELQQSTSEADLNSMRHATQALYITPQQLYQWIDFLAHLTQQNNLLWLAAQPLQTIQANFYQELPLHLRITGSYQHITLFLAKIANLSPLFLPASFSLYPKNKTTVADQLLLDLTLHAFALNKNSSDAEKFTTPEIKKINLELLHDPFSPALIQHTFSLNNLKMIGSMINQQKQWALVQNGHEVLHVNVGQQLDAQTQVTAITDQAITIQQINSRDPHAEPHVWHILLQEKTP